MNTPVRSASAKTPVTPSSAASRMNLLYKIALAPLQPNRFTAGCVFITGKNDAQNFTRMRGT